MIQIKIERIGDDAVQLARLYRSVLNDGVPGLGDATIGPWPSRAWCAEIIGTDPKYKLARNFLKANVDYLKANKKGSRGIYAFYNLEEGHLYEISSPISWRRTDRHFARVENDKLIEMDKAEVEEWLKSRSA